MLPSHTRKHAHEKNYRHNKMRIFCEVYQKFVFLHQPDGDFTTNELKCAQISGGPGAWWVVDVRGPHRIRRVSITSGENNGKYHTDTQTQAHTHRIFFYNYVLVRRHAASKFLHTSWGHLQ